MNIISSKKNKISLLMLFLIAVFALGPLLISSVVNQTSFERGAQAQSASIRTDLPTPSALTLTGLDSTIRANWTPACPSVNPPPECSQVTFQVFSAWDGETLVGAKLVGASARVADANGLVPDHNYTIKVQSMNAAGELSEPVVATTMTIRQQPRPGAIFYEDFNGMMGDNEFYKNYLDIRADESVSVPDSINVDKRLFLANEHHFHTQLIGSAGHLEFYIRPRMMMDISDGQLHTFQFEVDMPPTQRGHGKWFAVHFSQNLPSSAAEFGDNTDQAFRNSLGFTLRGTRDELLGQGKNLPEIILNIEGNEQVFDSPTPLYTGTNVRVPVILRISRTRAEMWVNGTKVIERTGFNLPWSRGYITMSHRSYYSGRWFNNYARPAPMTNQLIHWDTMQFDSVPLAQTNAKPYTIRTYIQPGCAGIVQILGGNVKDCPEINLGTYHHNFNIEEDVTLARSANVLFNGGDGQVVTADINGRGQVQITGTGGIHNKINIASFNPAWLVQGQNVITLTANNGDISQVETEVVYDIQKQTSQPSNHPMGMLTVTKNNFVIDRISTDPMTFDLQSFVYSLGSADGIQYSAQVITDTPWLTILSPTSGTLFSPAIGGGATPFTMRVDYNHLPPELDAEDGTVGVIKISGGTMPAYIAVLARYAGTTRPAYITDSAYTPVMTSFNRDWDMLCYTGCGVSPTPTQPVSSPTPTNTPTPIPPTPTHTPTPIPPTPTRTPTPTNMPSISPFFTSTPMPTVPPPSGSWSAEYFNNRNASGTPATPISTISAINFNWGFGSPHQAVRNNHFSARWRQRVYVPTAGTYRFYPSHDDGMRVVIDGQRVYDSWYNQSAGTQDPFDRNLSIGYHDITVTYYDYTQEAEAYFRFERL